MLDLKKEYHLFPKGDFKGRLLVALLLWAFIVVVHLYGSHISAEGFFGRYMLLIYLAPGLAFLNWMETEDKDKHE